MALVAIVTAAVMALSAYSAPKASAAGYQDWCTGWVAPAYQTCAVGTFHYIAWSKVILVSNTNGRQGCASALNGNGVLANPYVCTSTGLRAYQVFDGSRRLRGIVKNNTSLLTGMHGNEYYY